MSDNFIDKVTAATIVGTMFDNITVKPLRPQYVFDALSKEKVWNLSTPPKKGDAMSFQNLSALTANTAALDATNDIIGTGAEKLTYARRTVTLGIYGDHSAVDLLGLSPEAMVDPLADAGWSMADQAANSLNKIARLAYDLNRFSNEASGTISSTYHSYGSAGTATGFGPLRSADVRRVFTHLKSNNVQAFGDGMYVAVVDPKGIQQVRAESGDNGWRAVQVNNANFGREIMTGECGSFEGFSFITSNECKGSGTQTITAYFMGREAVGKAVGKDVSVSLNSTMRGVHENIAIVKWNALLGYRVIRRVALHTVTHSDASV
jgi:N4-gp56 family major capsid protein